MTSVAYPQANGQAKASNKTILHGLKTQLEKEKSRQANELPSILWAYRTTNRVSTGGNVIQLGVGTNALIPIEVDLSSPRVVAFNKGGNSDCLRENLDLLDELGEKATTQLVVYQRRIFSYYNQKVHPQTFQERDLVLRKIAITNALREKGKLRPNWEGPYKIVKMLGLNTSVLQTLQDEVLGKTWNTMHLKRYFPTALVTGDARRDNEQGIGSHMPRGMLLDRVMDQDPFQISICIVTPLDE